MVDHLAESQIAEGILELVRVVREKASTYSMEILVAGTGFKPVTFWL
jgi:hypothetical protein